MDILNFQIHLYLNSFKDIKLWISSIIVCLIVFPQNQHFLQYCSLKIQKPNKFIINKYNTVISVFII
jgi:hypothetical protein